MQNMPNRPLLFAAIVSLLVYGSVSQSGRADEPVRLRVLSYNIHHAEGVDRKLDLSRIAAVINDVRPDIVAVQEVDRRAQRSADVDQPAELARLTNLKPVFGPNIKFQGGDYGNLLLTKLPIVSSQNHSLPNHESGEQRGVIEAELKIDQTNESLVFYATHLDHRRNDVERRDSAKAINELVKKHKSSLGILAGDLNATPTSKTLEIFQNEWTIPKVDQDQFFTVPVNKPARQIDFILSRPAVRWNVVEIRVLDEKVASDHRAVFAILELSPVK
jgi:endonuclease/exonuclease/phosphatase family metal-dependent hydrolase